MNDELLNLDALQLLIWSTILIFVFIIGSSFIWYQKRNGKIKLNSSSKELFDIKHLEQMVHSFSELNEIEKFQLSTLLNDIVSEPKLSKNEKVLTLDKFIQKTLRVKTNKVKKIPLKYKDSQKSELIEIERFRLKLITKHFNLTDSEIELCVFIVEGKNSIQISELTNLTPGTIRVYKNKLKTKLELNPNENLNNYLTNI